MKFIIFDLDDTLLSGDCEKHWINFIIKKELINKQDYLIKINKFDEDYIKGILNFEEYSSFMLRPLIGLNVNKLNLLLKEFISDSIDNLSDKLTKELLLKAKNAENVLIASGSHDFLVKSFADYFSIDCSIGTPVEIKDNLITGNLNGEATFSFGKLNAVNKWCLERNLDLSQAIFYSDSINDLPMLEACGTPIVVNPDSKLSKIAEINSYKIIER